MAVSTVRGAAILVVVLSAACGQPAAVTAPSATTASPVSPAPPPSGDAGVPDFPVISRPARVYDDLHRPLYPPKASRFVLYDSGTFALQVVNTRSSYLEYAGTYPETNGHVSFHFYSWLSSPAEPSATGVLTDDSLTVRYSLLMGLIDFADGVYLRSR